MAMTNNSNISERSSLNGDRDYFNFNENCKIFVCPDMLRLSSEAPNISHVNGNGIRPTTAAPHSPEGASKCLLNNKTSSRDSELLEAQGCSTVLAHVLFYSSLLH